MSTTAIDPRSPGRSMVTLARFAVPTAVVLAGWWLAQLDRPVYDGIVAHRDGPLTSVSKAVTQVGSPAAIVVLAVVVAVVLFVRTRSLLTAAVPLVASAVAGIVELTVKQLVGRPRPPVSNRLVPENGPSFPSGHATVSAALLTTVILLAPALVPERWVRALRVVAGAAIVLIGTSRLYLGVHWPIDVFVGWLIGCGIGAAMFALFRAPDPDRATRPSPT